MLLNSLDELLENPTDHRPIFDVALPQPTGHHPAEMILISNQRHLPPCPSGSYRSSNPTRRPANDNNISLLSKREWALQQKDKES